MRIGAHVCINLQIRQKFDFLSFHPVILFQLDKRASSDLNFRLLHKTIEKSQ